MTMTGTSGGSDHSRGMCADHGMGTGKKNQISCLCGYQKYTMIRGADRADDSELSEVVGVWNAGCMEHLRIW